MTTLQKNCILARFTELVVNARSTPRQHFLERSEGPKLCSDLIKNWLLRCNTITLPSSSYHWIPPSRAFGGPPRATPGEHASATLPRMRREHKMHQEASKTGQIVSKTAEDASKKLPSYQGRSLQLAISVPPKRGFWKVLKSFWSHVWINLGWYLPTSTRRYT